MNKYPTLEGYVLVAPLDHLEQVTGDMSAAGYLELQAFVYCVAEAVRKVMEPERVYILSLGSQSANTHIHWHIAPLPHGVPLEEQQYHALGSGRQLRPTDRSGLQADIVLCSA
jgi:diadenosine tetraphosphate (Ap4A) HIT family hydrolase